MFKKSIPYISMCLLIVTVILGIATLVQLKAEPNDDISTASVVGTYATNDPSVSSDATYLVMDKDGSYCIYKQLAEKAIDEGTYKAGSDGKYIMESSMTDKYEALCIDGCICIAGEGRTIMCFETYDDVPSYINFNK